MNLDFSACAAPNGTNTIRFQSEGWPLVEVELDTLEPKEEEKEESDPFDDILRIFSNDR